MTKGKKNALGPAIHRVPLQKLTIFEITEDELEDLEQGSPDSLFMNLAIFTLSIAVSFLISLLTTEIKSTALFCIFVIITVVGALAGTTYLMLWWRSYSKKTTVAQIIRSRIIPEGIQESLAITDQQENSST